AIRVDEIRDRARIVPRLLEEERGEIVEIGLPGIERLPAAATAEEMSRGALLRQRSRRTDRIREGPERGARQELVQRLAVPHNRMLEIARRRVPRMTVRERVTAELVVLLSEDVEIAGDEDFARGRAAPHEAERRVVRAAQAEPVQD